MYVTALGAFCDYNTGFHLHLVQFCGVWPSQCTMYPVLTLLLIIETVRIENGVGSPVGNQE